MECIGSKAYYNAGDVGIGTANPTQKLHVAGNLAVAGQIVHPSDRRLKTDIKDIKNGLSTINQLAPKNYQYSKTKSQEFGLASGTQFGLIAQEVKEVLPEIVVEKALVAEDGTEYIGLNYEKLIPILVAAVKELSQENNELKINQQKEIDALNAKVNAMVKDLGDKTSSK